VNKKTHRTTREKKHSSPDKKENEELKKKGKRKSGAKEDPDEVMKWNELSKKDRKLMVETARRAEKDSSAGNASSGMPVLVPSASNLADLPGTSSSENYKDFSKYLNQVDRENFTKFLESNNIEKGKDSGGGGYDPAKYKKSPSRSRSNSPTKNLSESGKAQSIQQRRKSDETRERILFDWQTTDGSEAEVDTRPKVPDNENSSSTQPNTSSSSNASKARFSETVKSMKGGMLKNEDVVQKKFLFSSQKAIKEQGKKPKESVVDKINGSSIFSDKNKIRIRRDAKVPGRVPF